MKIFGNILLAKKDKTIYTNYRKNYKKTVKCYPK